jgi:hypothetical protein
VIQKIKNLAPTSPEDVRKAGIKMRLLGTGMFRSGYKVRNTDVVLKFPVVTSGDREEGIQHSKQEIDRLRRLKRAGTVEQFLPEVFYYNKKTGVIAMRYYPAYDGFEEQADAMGKMVSKLFYRIARVRCTDIHTENVRKGENAIIIDLGF